jgi:enoyl-CoA hydratase/carnithine racemase
MPETGVDVERDGPVLSLTINRPSKKNSLTAAMYRSLVEGFDALEEDDTLRVGLLHGAGDDFCAGNDIGELATPPVGQGGPSFLRRIATMSKPIVAGVRGVAIGIGATMLLHCDILIVGSDLDLRFPFVDLGLSPEAASSLLLARRAGTVRASEALLLGASIDADRAVAWGIANESLDPSLVLTRAREVADALASKPPIALRATRALLRGDPEEVLARMEQEGAVFSQLRAGPEFEQAARRFFERRRR